MDGKKFQWLIVGMYQDKWWEKNLEDTTCTAAEIQKALIGTMVLDILPLASNEDITISRRVSLLTICLIEYSRMKCSVILTNFKTELILDPRRI